LVGITIQILKNLIFNNWERPLNIFEANEFNYLEIERLTKHSFPSGHSAIATAWTLLPYRFIKKVKLPYTKIIYYIGIAILTIRITIFIYMWIN